MQDVTDRHHETGGWSLDDIQQEFGDVLCWLDQIGVRYEDGRFGQYSDQLGRLLDARRTGDTNTETEIEKAHWDWFYEMVVLLDVFRGRKRIRPAKVFRQKLEQICSGPLTTKQEQPGKTFSRDTQWELLVAAKLANTGHTARLENCAHSNLPVDVSFTRQRTIALIECKRVSSEDALFARFKDGLAQLRGMKGDISRWVPRRGIVAFDVTALTFPELHGQVYESEQEEFNRYQDRHQELSERMLYRLAGMQSTGGAEGYKRKYQRISCFIFRSVSYRPRRRDNRKMFLQFWTVVANNNAASRKDVDWAKSLANAWDI